VSGCVVSGRVGSGRAVPVRVGAPHIGRSSFPFSLWIQARAPPPPP
jgi:hypothetical protein